MNTPTNQILISATDIQNRVAVLGKQISKDYEGQSVVLIGILKGSIMFFTDLAKHITVPCAFDFITLSSYSGLESDGIVKCISNIKENIAGKNVIVVEDIVDTGLTINYLLDTLSKQNPASLNVCTLLDKVSRRTHPIKIRYKGFDIPDKFVIGYGMDYNEQYRNLPFIGVLSQSAPK
jgi:hypoxanthine phosphoribosyltransferase